MEILRIAEVEKVNIYVNVKGESQGNVETQRTEELIIKKLNTSD